MCLVEQYWEACVEFISPLKEDAIASLILMVKVQERPKERDGMLLDDPNSGHVCTEHCPTYFVTGGVSYIGHFVCNRAATKVSAIARVH